MRFFLFFQFTLFFTLGFSQNSLHFDGSDDGVNCGTSTLLNVGNKAFSIEAWIYADQFKTNIYDGSIIMKENNSNNGGFMFRAGAGGKLNFGIGSGTNSSWIELSSAAVLSSSTWHHVAATYDGSYMRLYIDGSLTDSLSATISVGGSSTTPLTLGYHPVYASRGWSGRIDEVRIWDTTRTVNQIKQNRNDEFCSFSTPHLVGYYKLDAGIAQGSNTGKNRAIDYSSSRQNGTLTNFTLNGSNSNWHLGKVLGQDTITNTDSSSNCGPYYDRDLKTYISKTSLVTKHFVSYTGCDSAYSKYIEIKSNTNSTQSYWVCDSLTSITGKIYRKSGTYYDIIPNYLGCDSIITTQLKVGADTSFMDTSMCDIYISSQGNTYTKSGRYFETYMSHLGCDSILQLDLEIIPTTYSSITLETCDSIQNLTQTQWLKPGDIVTDTIVNRSGCDSIVRLTVESLKSAYKMDESACLFYTSPSGKVYTSSGVYADTLINVQGCDSVLSIHLTIRIPSTEVIKIDACFETVLPTSGELVTSSGMYYDTLMNMQGCDSFVTMDVLIRTVNTQVKEAPYKLTALSSSGSFQWLDCSFGYSQLPGEVSATLDYANSGQYAVEISDNQCIDTSACYGLTGLGVSDFAMPYFQCIPHPNRGRFVLVTQEPTQNAELQIYTLTGRLVTKSMLQNGRKHSIDFDLDPGIYRILILDNHIHLGRLIIY